MGLGCPLLLVSSARRLRRCAATEPLIFVPYCPENKKLATFLEMDPNLSFLLLRVYMLLEEEFNVFSLYFSDVLPKCCESQPLP